MDNQQHKITKVTEVLDEIYTVSDLNNYIRMIDSLKPIIFQQGNNLAQTLQQELPPKLSNYITTYAETTNLNLNDQADAQRLVQQIVYILHLVPVAELTVPAPLTNKQIIKITQWWRSKTDKAVILNIKIDPDLIAGIRIGFEGKYADYSLNTWLQEKGKKHLDKVQI